MSIRRASIRHLAIRSLPLLALLILSIVSQARAQTSGALKYDSFELNAGKLTYKVFKQIEDHNVDLSGLVIWSEAPTTLYVSISEGEDPDSTVRLSLVRNGYATLKDSSTASDDYIKAQQYAKEQGNGIWKKELPKPTPVNVNPPTQGAPVGSFPSPILTPTAKESPTSQPTTGIPWSRLKDFVVFWGGFGVLVAGLVGLTFFIVAFLNKRRLFLIMLGSRSSGKTTVYKRMFHPFSQPEECVTPRATIQTDKTVSSQSVNWGKYVVSPIYVDTAGGQYGEQINSLIKRDRIFRKLVKPSRFVWIIVLATCQDSRITKAHADGDKLSSSFVSEQLGHLSLPLSILQSPKKPILSALMSLAGYSWSNPDMVIACINKSDLYLQNQNDREGKLRLASFFNGHLGQIKQACSVSRTKFNSCIVSACEGWDTSQIRDLIERDIYSAASSK